MKRLARRGIGSPTSADIAKLGENLVIPAIHRELDQIRALAAPPGAEHKINGLLDEEKSTLDKMKVEPSLFVTLKDPFAREDKLAKEYGLSACGTGA